MTNSAYISCLARWRRVRRARFWNSDYWAPQLAFIYIWHYFYKNANVPLNLDKRWQLWELGVQNCLFLQQKLITTEIYEGKIITQPWWCQCWRNFISIFWSLNGQLDAWNQDYLNEMWCQNICQAKVSSFIFKLSKFNFPISRSWKTWSFILTFLFWILANKLSSTITESTLLVALNRRRANQIAWIFFWQNIWQAVASDWLILNFGGNEE